MRKSEDYEYWKHPAEGFPKTIHWKVVAGNRQLSVLEDHDLVFDEHDLAIRKVQLGRKVPGCT